MGDKLVIGGFLFMNKVILNIRDVAHINMIRYIVLVAIHFQHIYTFKRPCLKMLLVSNYYMYKLTLNQLSYNAADVSCLDFTSLPM